jgi:hypothetical protein
VPTIRLKRGSEANLPDLSVGEPGFTTDTGKLFIGNDAGNIEFAKQSVVTSELAKKATILQQSTIPTESEEGTLWIDTSDNSFQGTVFEGLTIQMSERVKKGEQCVFVKDFGAVGDGITDDTTAIQNAINYANVNNLPVLFEPKEYLVSQVTFKKAKYFLKGTSFKMKNALTGNIYALDLESGVIADFVSLNIPTGITGERFIRVQSSCHIDKIKLASVDQQSILNDNLDGAVNITGSNHYIGDIEVVNCDYAVVVYNTTSSLIGRVKVQSFVRGLYVRQSKNIQFQTVHTEIKSPNGTQNPGHNSVLLEECEEIRFPNVYAYDAGEHGIRIGGTQGGLYLQKRLSFGNVITRRTGQCGFKAYTGAGDVNKITYLSIHSLHVYDCAYANTPGTNEDGLYLIGCQHVNVGQLFVDSELNAVSGYNGMYVSNCDFISVGTVNIRNVTNCGIHLDSTIGRVNDFYLESATIRKTGADAIFVDHMLDIMRDIILKGLYIREFGASNYGVKVMSQSTTVGANQPVLAEGYVSKGASIGIFYTNTTDTDVYNKLVQLT